MRHCIQYYPGNWQVNNRQVVARAVTRRRRVRWALNRFLSSQSIALLTADSRLMHKHASQYRGLRESRHLLCHDGRDLRAYVSFSFSPYIRADDSRAVFVSRIPLVIAYRIVSLAHKARPRTPRMTNAAIWRRSLCVTFTIGVLKPAGVQPRTSLVKIQFACRQASMPPLVRFSPFPPARPRLMR